MSGQSRAVRVDLAAIAVATSSFERASILAMLVETKMESTLSEITKALPLFIEEHAGVHARPVSTGQTSWSLNKLASVNLVEITADKKYRATPTAYALYETLLSDAYYFSSNPNKIH